MSTPRQGAQPRTSRSRRPAGGLAERLLLAQALVVLVGGATLWLVAAAVGPSIFHNHLHKAGDLDPATNRHVEDAYRSASAISISVALAASLVAALAISAFVTRRIAGPVARLAAAAQQIAAGRYDVYVTEPSLGAEFSTLTTSFAAMADRLADVERTRRRLLADLAHEVRTPVAVLDGYLEGLQDDVVTVDADTLAMLRTQTARLTRLATDIAEVSRAEEHQLDLHPVAVSPRDLVEAARAAAADRFTERAVTLTTGAVADLPVVAADGDRVGQVFTNLLDNALRHTPPGGTVTMTAAPAAAGRAVRFSVTDTGAGIPAEHLPHIFERFYRSDAARDRSRGGSGIGLAIVKAVVEAHGGTVQATSPGLGGGATVTFTLPTA